MKWFIKCFKQYADFKGRARRKEYWMFYLLMSVFVCVFMFVPLIIGALLGLNLDKVAMVTQLVLFFPCLLVAVPILAVTVRRLHDVGKSGWMWFIQLIPLIGPIWLFVLIVTDSQPGVNKYGPNPKEMEAF